MSIDPKTFYEARLLKIEDELSDTKKKLNFSSTVRLLVAIAVVLGIYLFWGKPEIWVPILSVGVVAFTFLVLRHNRLKYQRSLGGELVARNRMELRVLHRDFHDLPEGTEFLDSKHVFVNDIDLFGRGSFYQYMNRTSLERGSKVLARLLLSNDIEGIELKQDAVKELATKPEWRQEYGATAALVKTELHSHRVTKWLLEYESFLPASLKVWIYVFCSIASLVILGCFTSLISWFWLLPVFISGMGITGKFLKKINRLSAHTSKIQNTFTQYSRLLSLLETQEFDSKLLADQKEAIKNKQHSSSESLRQFSKLLDRLDQRNNILVGFILNGFFLRDLIICGAIEVWISVNKSMVPKWFDAIAFFDAYNSLGNYAFNHPGHIYPTIQDNDITLRSAGMAHPMLDPKKAVGNNITISKDEFFIVTGANMAGKSTFLRTVALHIVMTNIGLPVCAKSSEYSPIKLITSMRTTDSLADDESYFFSELKRLKFIVDQMDADQYFIVLDEILKGTNSVDKAIGSQKFVKRLVGLGGTGIIATHDLNLCEVAEKLEGVSNYYFDAQIKDEELFFDYQFKEGVCKNMNASFLLKKMGIVE